MSKHINDASVVADRFFTDLVQCEIRLFNAVSERLRAECGIGVGPFGFLRYIRDHAEARVGDLAAAFTVGIGATSKGVDRLERDGLVARRPNPADRRSSLLALTEAGARILAAAETVYAREVAALLTAALAPEQIAAVADACTALRADLEARRIGLPIG